MKGSLNADNYRLNIPAIKHLTREMNAKQRLEFCGRLAIMTGVPIVVIGYYLAEIYGMDEKLKSFINKMKDFYHIGIVYNTIED